MKVERVSESGIDPAYFRRKLIELRDELTEVGPTGDEAAQPVELDQSRVGRLSRMDALRAQSMSIEVKRRREAKLRGVGAALRRIEQEEFGVCSGCEEQIDPRRLEFDPTLELCIDCASRNED